jgi:hypothetical protein
VIPHGRVRQPPLFGPHTRSCSARPASNWLVNLSIRRCPVNAPPRPLRAGETVTLIVQLENWRVLRVADRPGWGDPSWSLQQWVDGRWCGEAMFRVSASVRDYLKARAGTIDPQAAAILEALPKRCDRDPAHPPPSREKRPAVVRPAVECPAVKAAPTKRPPTGKRAALASKFLQWRSGKPAHALAGSQAIPAAQAENNSQAPRAASALQQAEATP